MTRGFQNPWLLAEEVLLLTFVKKREGDALAPIGQNDSVWEDLAKACQALGKVKDFGTHRTAKAMYDRHRQLRREVGWEDNLQTGRNANVWSPEEEEALLSFLKERRVDELAVIGLRDGVWLELEKAWQALGNAKGFGIRRTATAL